MIDDQRKSEIVAQLDALRAFQPCRGAVPWMKVVSDDATLLGWIHHYADQRGGPDRPVFILDVFRDVEKPRDILAAIAYQRGLTFPEFCPTQRLLALAKDALAGVRLLVIFGLQYALLRRSKASIEILERLQELSDAQSVPVVLQVSREAPSIERWRLGWPRFSSEIVDAEKPPPPRPKTKPLDTLKEIRPVPFRIHHPDTLEEHLKKQKWMAQVMRPRGPHGTPLNTPIRDAFESALPHIARAIGQFCTYHGQVDVHFFREADVDGHHLVLSAPIDSDAYIEDWRRQREPVLPSDSYQYWDGLADHLANSLAETTWYMGPALFVFRDDRCSHASCPHPPAHFAIEAYVQHDNRTGLQENKLLRAGMIAVDLEPSYRSINDEPGAGTTS